MKRFVLVLVFSVVVLAWPAQAQDPPTLSSLEISLWPEFDQPEVLVIYRGLFAADTELPLPVEIRIPASVGAPSAVAYVGEGGQRLNQQHTTRIDGDWLVVSFELTTLGFQLEYYDTLPVDADGVRTYTYAYTADYATEALNLEFQVPPTAEGFELDPPADSVGPETDGLVYHLVDAGSVEQGETQSWAFSYLKDNADLTVSVFLQDETPAPVAPAAPEEKDNSTVLIFFIGFVALIAIGAAAFWLGSRTQSGPPPAPAPRQQKRRGSGRGEQPQRRRLPPVGPEEEAFFCHHCGTKLRSDSEFCHKCGTTVREV